MIKSRISKRVAVSVWRGLGAVISVDRIKHFDSLFPIRGVEFYD